MCTNFYIKKKTKKNSPPWFNITLSSPTTDDIEVRICGDHGIGEEDIPIQLRRGKLNLQFIVTRFSILHAGGRSLFRFHISPTATFSMIARDKRLTRLCSPAFRDLRRS